MTDLSSLRLKDLETFVEVARARSIREVARRQGTTSGQVSKTIQGLEKRLGTKLFKRSPSGVFLTSQGNDLQILAQEVLVASEKIESLISGKSKEKFRRVLAVAGTSFLNTHFTTPLVCRTSHQMDGMLFRFLDLPPDQIVQIGMRGIFDIAVHFGKLSWPSTWTSKPLGPSRWLLCAGTHHPLPKNPILKQVLEYPFVVPTYWTSEGLAWGNDQFPLPFSKRKTGFETATADAAIPILQETDHLAFLPELLVFPFIESQKLREVRTKELPSVEKELFISAKADAVPLSVFRLLSDQMTEALLQSKKSKI